MYESRVSERGCGLTATVVEGVHVEDKASEKPPMPTSNIACFQNRFAHPDCVRVLLSPIPNALALSASESRLPGSQAETDLQIQQESDMTALMYA